jgi:FkbM family methyltransferase
MLQFLVRKFKTLNRGRRNLGWLPATIDGIQILRLRTGRIKGCCFPLYSKHARHPLRCRPGTSDLNVFYQIFVFREYRCLDDITSADLIVDCGANVGYSSAYFLTRFPRAKVISIEPDPGNFALLQANTAPYGNRCQAICSAVWSHPTQLVLATDYGDGREWARQVRIGGPGEVPTVSATDIGTLLAESGFDRISILKVDIEGAEAAVFGANYEQWITQVDNIVIELHDDRCRSAFMNAISTQGNVLSRCDELVVCRRPHSL